MFYKIIQLLTIILIYALQDKCLSIAQIFYWTRFHTLHKLLCIFIYMSKCFYRIWCNIKNDTT